MSEKNDARALHAHLIETIIKDFSVPNREPFQGRIAYYSG